MRFITFTNHHASSSVLKKGVFIDIFSWNWILLMSSRFTYDFSRSYMILYEIFLCILLCLCSSLIFSCGYSILCPFNAHPMAFGMRFYYKIIKFYTIFRKSTRTSFFCWSFNPRWNIRQKLWKGLQFLLQHTHFVKNHLTSYIKSMY